GFGYWSHDIGGFEGTPDPTVFKRWTAFGLLSSHSRLHGSNSYRVPWLFDEESVEVMREFTELKRKLLPYLLETAEHTTATGAPMMRSMAMQFPQDPACRPLDTQYMLGPDVLVAPVFQASGRVEMYLPEGEWVHLFDGERVPGGRFPCRTSDVRALGGSAGAGPRAAQPARGGEVTTGARPTGRARRTPTSRPTDPRRSRRRPPSARRSSCSAGTGPRSSGTRRPGGRTSRSCAARR